MIDKTPFLGASKREGPWRNQHGPVIRGLGHLIDAPKRASGAEVEIVTFLTYKTEIPSQLT
jgi:hypothetical protein